MHITNHGNIFSSSLVFNLSFFLTCGSEAAAVHFNFRYKCPTVIYNNNIFATENVWVETLNWPWAQNLDMSYFKLIYVGGLVTQVDTVTASVPVLWFLVTFLSVQVSAMQHDVVPCQRK